MTLPFQFKYQTILEEGRTTQVAIDTIKEWLETTTLPQMQEEFITLFLLSCDNVITVTKKTIETYFRVKNSRPEIFNGWDTKGEELKKILDVIHACVIPKRMEDNVIVICTKLNDTNYRNCNALAVAKMGVMLLHLCQMSNPPSQLVAVLNMKGVGFMHITCLKMRVVLSFLEYIQEALPLKIKTIHILNTNYVFDRALSLFRMFIKGELIEAIQVHPPGMDMDEFHKKWIPKSCLPKEYGGDLPVFDEMAEGTFKDLKEMQGFFEAEEKFRCCNEI